MTYLLPHVWDKYGDPPPLGDPSAWSCSNGHNSECTTPDFCIAALEAAADIEFEDEEFHRDQARDAEKRGDDLRVRADDIRERLLQKRQWS